VREPLEAVLFDYGHTLISFDERPHSALMGAYEKVNELLRATLKEDVPAANVLIERVSKAVDEEIQRDYAAGREEEVEIAAIYDTALRGLGLTVEPRLVERVMELEQEGWLGSVHVGPDVHRTLEYLRDNGLRLGLVSNAAYLPRLMTQQLAALGLKSYFDGLTFSSEVGVRKPSPKIYTDALDKVRVRPSRALFIGDRIKEDVQGPQSLGMLAVLTREFRQEDDAGVADFVIQRLGELPAIIDGLLTRPPSATTYNGATSRD